MAADLYSLTIWKFYYPRAVVCGIAWSLLLPISVHAVPQAYVLQFNMSVVQR